MDNPVGQERVVHWKPPEEGKEWGERESVPAYKEVIVWCPGCRGLHHPTVEIFDNRHKRNDGSDQPVWTWNGALDATITFEPSILAYSTVHLCEGEHAPLKICDRDFSECGHNGHGYVWTNAEGEQRTFKVYEEIPEGWEKHTFAGGDQDPHPRDPAYGNCHSFLRNGVWEFLGDSAHRLAGQRVPVEPLPDWYLRD